jgi:RNA polymerase sigma factor (TIGR02999 family)
MEQDRQITELLAAWNAGADDSLEQLMPLVEHELRKIAHNYMRRENPDHTLQTTALVNEAYLKLIGQTRAGWQNRAHFFAIAAQIMRRILLNHARDRAAGKRGGGGVKHVELENAEVLSRERSRELIALDEALDRLAEFDRTKSRIVELRYFGGLTIEETAEVLGIGPATVSMNWRLARAWLAREVAAD